MLVNQIYKMNRFGSDDAIIDMEEDIALELSIFHQTGYTEDCVWKHSRNFL